MNRPSSPRWLSKAGLRRISPLIAVAGIALLTQLLFASAPARATALDPSGVPMPGNNVPGYTLRFADDFNGTSLNTNDWYTYSGHPAGQTTYFAPSHDVVKNGVLIIRGYRDYSPAYHGAWTTGGVSSGKVLSQTYGYYEVRMRMQMGVGITYDALLWPSSGQFPPELDFAEDDSQTRSTVNAFQHFYDPKTGKPGQFTNRTSINMNHWQTVGIKWSPDRVQFLLNGRVWATENNIYVSDVPMELDLQTEALACTGSNQCIASTTPANVNLYVAWVVEYSRNS